MELPFETLRKSERVAYLLRSLYEQYGYEKFRMGKFEEYDFYTEHKDFLPSGQILTFTDLSGKLMALKPDVTMSIVKRTHASLAFPERLYYNESIYRASREAREYKEIFQVGLEYIGEVSAHTNVEMVTLALKSLACIEQEHVLDLSHMGFLNGLLESVKAPRKAKHAMLQCVKAKNAHELAQILQEFDIAPPESARMLALITLNGDIGDALKKAEGLVVNEQMEEALSELFALYSVFKESGHSLRLDFSITLDSKYYNGLLFHGYVKGVPSAVLSGGRYDLLLRRMGIHELQAIGFALYFDELERYLQQPCRTGYDTVLLYDEHTDPAALHAARESLISDGKHVFACKALPETAASANTAVYRLRDGKLEEQL